MIYRIQTTDYQASTDLMAAVVLAGLRLDPPHAMETDPRLAHLPRCCYLTPAWTKEEQSAWRP